MQGRGRRTLLLVAGAVAVWYLIVLFSWAIRPLHDAVPIGTDPATNQPVSQSVTCNTLFSGTTHDGPLPTLRTILPLFNGQFEYNRPVCDLVQKDARIVFGLDTLGMLVVVGGLLFFALRTVPEPEPIAPPSKISVVTT
ncbi:MAG: hypothetical protein JWN39_2593 [Ilumatobacteraceae bacterium]|nr:hypothetical protein [Ilumatobacteraceae bacterium]